jgi:hypothetical protein
MKLPTGFRGILAHLGCTSHLQCQIFTHTTG